MAVYGLTLDGGKKPGDRVLYAATHGRGVWRLHLPNVPNTSSRPSALGPLALPKGVM